MPSQNEIRQQITNDLIASIEKGTMPWKRPWASDSNAPGLHTSLSTGSAYRGINQWILTAAAIRHGLTSKWWGTFNQINQAGASVQKGQKGTHVVLFKKIERERDDDGETTKDTFFMMRQFIVFNACQTTGLPQYEVGFSQPIPCNDETYAEAQRVLDATGADVRHGGNHAFYSPNGDYIQLPLPQQFESPVAYWETALHECCHWAESRVGHDRKHPDNTYGFLELVAEMGSCFLMGSLGMPTTNQASSYLSNWLQGMKGDSSFLFKASSCASKSADFVLSFSKPVEVTEPAEEPALA